MKIIIENVKVYDAPFSVEKRYAEYKNKALPCAIKRIKEE
jgi:hypothetical protein